MSKMIDDFSKDLATGVSRRKAFLKFPKPFACKVPPMEG
jgi:hypothetical protein